jgi:hypothetical protein
MIQCLGLDLYTHKRVQSQGLGRELFTLYRCVIQNISTHNMIVNSTYFWY